MTIEDELRLLYAATRHADEVPGIASDLHALLDGRGDGPTGEPGDAVPDLPRWSERDMWVIAYPDQARSPERPPLQALGDLLDLLAPEANGLHILPCYPWSSDDGYAVVDPLAIEPSHGTWADVRALAAQRRVMLDAVVNHLSAQSPSWRRFHGVTIAGTPPGQPVNSSRMALSVVLGRIAASTRSRSGQ